MDILGVDVRQGHGVAVAQIDDRMAADIDHAGRHVGSGIDVQAVDVAGDLQNVVTLLEVHHDILAAAAGEHESVVAGAAKQRVVAGSAVDDVVAGTAE